MPDITEAVGNSARSIPPIVWVGVIGAGLYWGYARNKSASTTPASQPDAVVYTGTGNPDTGNPGATGGSSVPTSPTAGPATNEEWYRLAINTALAKNYDANLADTAVRAYLSGQQLNQQQSALISEIIKAIGAPPTILPPTTAPTPVTPAAPVSNPSPDRFTNILPIVQNPVVTITPAPQPVQQPAPAPVVAPAPARYYTVQAGDSLWKIAVKYYGDGSQWTRIYNANRSAIKNPDLIYVGQRFIIP